MPRRRSSEKARRGALTDGQEMELEIGPGHRVASFFADAAARREAWFEHRDELLAQGPPGNRPWAWWRYESGLDGSPLKTGATPPAELVRWPGCGSTGT